MLKLRIDEILAYKIAIASHSFHYLFVAFFCQIGMNRDCVAKFFQTLVTAFLTHTLAALYQTFSSGKAQQMLSKSKLYCAPVHFVRY
jgi:hypothetical protein